MVAGLFVEEEEVLRIFESVCAKQPRTAVDLIVIWGLNALAGEIGLKLTARESAVASRLMKHDSYRRTSGAIRQVGWS